MLYPASCISLLRRKPLHADARRTRHQDRLATRHISARAVRRRIGLVVSLAGVQHMQAVELLDAQRLRKLIRQLVLDPVQGRDKVGLNRIDGAAHGRVNGRRGGAQLGVEGARRALGGRAGRVPTRRGADEILAQLGRVELHDSSHGEKQSGLERNGFLARVGVRTVTMSHRSKKPCLDPESRASRTSTKAASEATMGMPIGAFAMFEREVTAVFPRDLLVVRMRQK